MATIETFIDALMVEVASLTGNSTKSTAPYYRYGMKSFDTNESTPPQIRFEPTSWNITRLQQNKPITTAIDYGSNGIFEQNIHVTIWAATEALTFTELYYLIKAFNNIKNAGDNPLNLTQETLTDNVNGRWVDTSPKSVQGVMLEFEFTIRLNIPHNITGTSNTKVITSASFYITGSDEVPVVSGSSTYEGLKYFQGLSGSTYF